MKKLLLLLFLIPNLVMGVRQEVPCLEFSQKSDLYKLEKQEDGNLLGRADFNDDGIIDSYTIQSGEVTKEDPKGPVKIEILFKDKVVHTFNYVIE